MVEKWGAVWIVIIMTVLSLTVYGITDTYASAWVMFICIIVLFVGGVVIQDREETKRVKEREKMWKDHWAQMEKERSQREQAKKKQSKNRKL